MSKKITPLTLSGSTRAQLATKSPAIGRLGFVADDDNSLLVGNGTTVPWEYPTKTKVATMISAALTGVGTSTTATPSDHVHALPAAATTSDAGLARFATLAEVMAGTAVDAAVRPADLQKKINDLLPNVGASVVSNNIIGLNVPGLSRIVSFDDDEYKYLAFVCTIGTTIYPTLIYRTADGVTFDHIGLVANSESASPAFVKAGQKILLITVTPTITAYSCETGQLLLHVTSKTKFHSKEKYISAIAYSSDLLVVAGLEGYEPNLYYTFDLLSGEVKLPKYAPVMGGSDVAYSKGIHYKLTDGVLKMYSVGSGDSFLFCEYTLTIKDRVLSHLSMRSVNASDAITYGSDLIGDQFLVAVDRGKVIAKNLSSDNRMIDRMFLLETISSIDKHILIGNPIYYQHFSGVKIGTNVYLAVPVSLGKIKIYKYSLLDTLAPVIHSSIDREGVIACTLLNIKDKLVALTWTFGQSATILTHKVAL